MIIRTNTSSLRVYNAGRTTKSALSKNLEKLSTGYRINRSADDAAGLAVSERIHAKVTELGRCQRNASEGIDLARTADAALQEINDMLKRARGLCIQAENGTYGDQELTAISGEMNQLFREIDRITAGSYHNTICLFRQGVGMTYHEEVIEHYTPVSDALETWGDLDFIQKEDFDKAKEATPATATFKLDDSIDFNNVNTLEGKSIVIGSHAYTFTKGSSYGDRKVALKGTVEETLQGLVSASSDVSAVTVDKDARTVTLAASLTNLSEQVEADGRIQTFVAPNGRADHMNGVLVKNPMDGPPILQVDGSGSINNTPVYGKTATATFSLGLTDAYLQDAANVKNLQKNTLCVGDLEIKLNSTVVRKGWSADEVCKKIAGKIKGGNYSATYANGTFTITCNDTSKVTYFGIREETAPATEAKTEYDPDPSHTWTSQRLGLSVQVTTPASTEDSEQTTITIPDNPTAPFSFYAAGTTYLFYDSSTHTLKPSGYDSQTITPICIDIKDKSASQIRQLVADTIKNRITGGAVQVSGNKITVTCNSVNQQMGLSSKFYGTTYTIRPYKYTPPESASTPGLGLTVDSPFTRDVTVPFSLGSTFDKSALVGRGFSIGYSRFEFVDGPSSGLSPSYTDIDISNCTDFASLASRIQSVLRPKLGNECTATIDGSGKLEISFKNTVSYSRGDEVLDGNEGIIDGAAVKFAGGENVGHSQKAIDFSSINENNLDTLLGKGFRINCATCSGEYINVFFCWKDDGSLPLIFERKDPETGKMRTIHNIPVELSKVTSGDKIVEDIVRQVRPTLKHYTDVMVGDRPTILLAVEKRPGDVMDKTILKLGSVETGMEANFTYSIERKMVADLPEGDLEDLKTSIVNIYAGSDPGPQIIPIHLPYIDLCHLRLSPPESVDLTAEDQDPADWLERIDRADLAISSARGTIGADYNRLEHAIQDLSNAHIQLSDAYSVIRDADMAELMKEQIKLQILMQAQQSMQAQANQMPQGVLQLLQ